MKLRMHKDVQYSSPTTIQLFAIASIAVLFLFVWEGSKGFSLYDEGYLWYGVQRVLLGEVPIRDFMAYDPGRYYWSAALLGVVGDHGILSLRASVAIFQVLGLFVALLLITKSVKSDDKYSAIFFAISTATLLVWMVPRHKLFDISLSIFLIATLVFLIEKPIPKRYFIAGVFIGLVAVFGRNHGIYGVVASLGVMVWLNLKRSTDSGFIRVGALWCTGVVVGFLPIIAMMFVIPGFANSFLQSIWYLFEQGSTNITLPIPWPWAVDFAVSSFSDASRGVLVGLFFISTLVFGVFAVLYVVHQKLKDREVSPVLVAAAFLALPYAHFAYSRADVSHLAQGIFPFLVGSHVILAATERRTKWFLLAGLFAVSFWVMHVFHPGWQCYSIKDCIDVEISGSNLLVDSGTARDIALLRLLAEQYAPNGQSFLVTPLWPGAYALLERKSPVWQIYLHFPRSDIFEKMEINRINTAKPGFVLVLDSPLDGRDELRFKNTHRLIHEYVRNNYEYIASPLNSGYELYKTKESIDYKRQLHK